MGAHHQKLRALIRPAVAGGLVRCCRGPECFVSELVNGVELGGFIEPGQLWDLDHTNDRRGYLGAAHAKCNRSAGARKRNAKTRRSRVW
jgi:hypothetical protein